MKETFRKELIQTGYVHSPLQLHQEKSLEREREEKPGTAHRNFRNTVEEEPLPDGTEWEAEAVKRFMLRCRLQEKQTVTARKKRRMIFAV